MVKSGARDEAAGAAVNTERAGTRRGIRLDGLTEMHNISASISGDASNRISAVSFKVGDVPRTEVAQGEAYEIYVDFRITRAYILANTPTPPVWPGAWKCIVAALCPSAGIYVLGDYTTPQVGFPTEIVQSGFRLGDYFSGSSLRKMGGANQAFTFYLSGSASTTVPNPTPTEIMAMPLQ